MIKFSNRADEYAYRRGNADLASSVTALTEGQWVTFDTNGQIVIAGASSVMAFMTTSSLRTGRDQLSGKPAKKVTYLYGKYEVSTDQYDKNGTYTAAMTPLKVGSGGVLTPATVALTMNTSTGAIATGDTYNKVVAYAIGGPDADGLLRIISV